MFTCESAAMYVSRGVVASARVVDGVVKSSAPVVNNTLLKTKKLTHSGLITVSGWLNKLATKVQPTA